MGTRKINIVCYADVVALTADTEDNLQRLLYQITIAAKAYNMEVAKRKTKCMTIAKDKMQIINRRKHYLLTLQP